jgi:hypothetical protein
MFRAVDSSVVRKSELGAVGTARGCADARRRSKGRRRSQRKPLMARELPALRRVTRLRCNRSCDLRCQHIQMVGQSRVNLSLLCIGGEHTDH